MASICKFNSLFIFRTMEWQSVKPSLERISILFSFCFREQYKLKWKLLCFVLSRKEQRSRGGEGGMLVWLTWNLRTFTENEISSYTITDSLESVHKVGHSTCIMLSPYCRCATSRCQVSIRTQSVGQRTIRNRQIPITCENHFWYNFGIPPCQIFMGGQIANLIKAFVKHS